MVPLPAKRWSSGVRCRNLLQLDRSLTALLALLQARQSLFGGALETAVRIYPEDGPQVVAGPVTLTQGHEGGGAVVVGDAELRVELYGLARGLQCPPGVV